MFVAKLWRGPIWCLWTETNRYGGVLGGVALRLHLERGKVDFRSAPLDAEAISGLVGLIGAGHFFGCEVEAVSEPVPTVGTAPDMPRPAAQDGQDGATGAVEVDKPIPAAQNVQDGGTAAAPPDGGDGKAEPPGAGPGRGRRRVGWVASSPDP